MRKEQTRYQQQIEPVRVRKERPYPYLTVKAPIRGDHLPRARRTDSLSPPSSPRLGRMPAGGKENGNNKKHGMAVVREEGEGQG